MKTFIFLFLFSYLFSFSTEAIFHQNSFWKNKNNGVLSLMGTGVCVFGDRNGGNNATVNDVFVENTSMYLAGNFVYAGECSGSGVPINVSNGNISSLAPNYHLIDGYTTAVVAHPSGGWIVSGAYKYVGGFLHEGLSKINADGTLDLTWNTSIPMDGLAVNQMKVHEGFLYLGGGTLYSDGFGSHSMAKIDLLTGSVNTAFNVRADASISDFEIDLVTDIMYLGGYFNNINIGGSNSARQHVAAVNLNTNVLVPSLSLSFTHTTTQTFVNEIEIGPTLSPSGDPSLYIGGEFETVGGNSRIDFAMVHANRVNQVATFDIGTLSTYFYNIEYDGISTYVLAGAIAHPSFAPTTATLLRLHPTTAAVQTNFGNSMQLDFVIVGSDIISANGRKANKLTGVIDTGWKTVLQDSAGNFAGTTFSMAANATEVYFAGTLGVKNPFLRRGLAKINLATGLVDPAFTSPITGTNHSVFSINKFSTSLLIGHTPVSGLDGLFAVNENTGAIIAGFNTDIDNPVYSTEIVGNTVYVGGDFGLVNSTARNRLAALDLTSFPSFVLLPWNPNANNQINQVKHIGGQIYVAGAFTRLSGNTSVRRLARVHPTTAAIDLAWLPNPDGVVQNIEHSTATNKLIAVGEFNNMGANAFRRFSAIDFTNPAAVTYVTPTFPNTAAQAVGIDNGWIYVGTDNDVRRYNETTLAFDPSWLPDTSRSGTFEAFDLGFTSTQVVVGGDLMGFGTKAYHGLGTVNKATGIASP